jgi:cobalamin-dependent methionine synthase I
VDLNRLSVLDGMIRPLMDEVGARWAQGRMRIVHGHLAANVVQACLERMLEAPRDASAGRPRMVIAAPAGQWCFLGALAVAVIVQDLGWVPALVGANLPSEEIAAACDIIDPQLLALSITCRIDDAYMHGELQRLAHYLGGRCPIIAGGRAAPRYRDSIQAAGGTVCDTAEHLLSLLQ